MEPLPSFWPHRGIALGAFVWFGKRAPPQDVLCSPSTPERQSLFESHRQRRWLTCWSYQKCSRERGGAEYLLDRALERPREVEGDEQRAVELSAWTARSIAASRSAGKTSVVRTAWVDIARLPRYVMTKMMPNIMR